MTTILKYQRMQTLLNEKQWRQYLATEAEERGNAAAVAREAGVSINTIARGRRDIEAGDLYRPGNRIRAKGAGPKRISVIDPTLIDDLESIVEPKGDPIEAPPDERGGNRYAQPTATAPHLDSTLHFHPE